MLATLTRESNTLVHALATLGGATEIEMILIAKASKVGDITSPYCRHFLHANLSNVNEP
jgi:hypothetical protein